MLHRFAYQDHIDNILAVPGRSQLIIVGSRYQYSFDDKKGLARATSASFSRDLSGSFGRFTVDWNNRIKGTYRVQTRHPLEGSQAQEALALGFVRLSDGTYELSADLDGQRHATTPLVANMEPASLDATFTMSVDVVGYPSGRAPDSFATRAGDAVMTPLLVPLLVITFIFFQPCLTCK